MIILNEMAAVTDKLKAMTFYHGVSDQDAAEKIKSDPEGLHGRETQGKAQMAPVKGAVYSTPSIRYAQIYAIGGDVAGTAHGRVKGEYAHVFSFSGSRLKDVQPDEDSVGELVHDKKIPWLNHLARTHLSDSRLKKIHDGEYSHWAAGGKTLLKKMSDDQKLDLIHNHAAHVANIGPVKPDHVYRIHKDKIPLLKQDGSNFFDHAEKIDMNNITETILTDTTLATSEVQRILEDEANKRLADIWKKTLTMSKAEYNKTVVTPASYRVDSPDRNIRAVINAQAEDTPENKESIKRFKDYQKNKFKGTSNVYSNE